MPDLLHDKMNVMVTGATGFIGSHLCKELLGRGYRVFALTHSQSTDNIKSLLPLEEFHLKSGDIRDAHSLKKLIRNNKIKVIFHLAAQLPDGNRLANPFIYFETNVRGTLNLLDTAYHSGVEKFIYASSMSVYSTPPHYLPVDEEHPTQPVDAYGIAKMSGELYCNLYAKAKALDTVILRYSAAYGLGDRKSSVMQTFIRQALQNEPVTIYGDGTQSSDFVYIDNIVRGTLLVWENNKSGIYNIGSGEETSVKRLAERIIDVTGSSSRIIFAKKNTDRPFRFYLDISKSRRELGYSPLLLDEGLSIYLKALYREVDKYKSSEANVC